MYVHKEEADWLINSKIFMMNRSITAKPADHIIDAEGALAIGSFNFEIFETPGHSPGSFLLL